MSFSAQIERGPVETAFCWCSKCEKKIRLDFDTYHGRLIQLPLSCGHKYDPDAKPPPIQVVNRGPAKQCANECGTVIYGPRVTWCRPCYEVRRAKLQREWRVKKDAEKSS